MEKQRDIAIIGGGILGIAHALEAAARGHSVVLFEREVQAQSASVRNFGAVWPIGLPPGQAHQRAMRSRERWLDIAPKANIWHKQTGSLHLAYAHDEFLVLSEFADLGPGLGYNVELLDARSTIARSNSVRSEHLLGSLWSDSELCIDPRQAIAQLPLYLSANYEVTLQYSTQVYKIDLPYIHTTKDTWRAQRAIVCNGSDFETLYPNVFLESGITRCKLQMMRTGRQPNGWEMGPSLVAGLSLRHYDSFKCCKSLANYSNRIAKELPDYDRLGIHVMASQNGLGEIVIGDSHEYDWQPSIFDNTEIDYLILKYLKTFIQVPSIKIMERWHGIYAKHPKHNVFIAEPDPGVTIVTGVGGTGMTTAFGLAEEILAENYATVSN